MRRPDTVFRGKRSLLIFVSLFTAITTVFIVVGCSGAVGSLGIFDTPTPEASKFGSADAVLVFRNTGRWNEGDSVRIYDDKGLVWYKAPFTIPNFQYSKDAGPNRIRPFSIERGDFSPEFRCIGISSHWYEVVVDEVATPRIRKFIKRGDPLFEFKNWSEYYINNGVTFRFKQTNVFASPDGEILKIVALVRPTVRAVDMKGDWLQISWEKGSYTAAQPESPDFGQKNSGWVRWREGEKFLVSLAWD